MPDSGRALLTCSFFRTALDNQPIPWRGTWEALVDSFGHDRAPAPLPDGHDPKKGLPGICGATFQAAAPRACANVVHLQLVLLDLDNAEEYLTGVTHPSGRPVIAKRPCPAPALLGPVCDELERLGIAAYAWSTWSHTPGWPRFRLVIPLAAPVRPEVWGQLGEWSISAAGLAPWRTCMDLPVLRDTARLNFLPAQRPGGPTVERRQVQGRILTPPTHEELAQLAPPRAELATWQQEALARRGGSRTGAGAGMDGRFAWANRFRGADGRPLDLRGLDALRLLGVLGCKVGPGRPTAGGVKHRTTCPWPAEHSHGLDDDSGVLFLEPGKWPAWRCSHSHHAHLGLFDLLEAAGVLQP
jgi:hypothetical protein